MQCIKIRVLSYKTGTELAVVDLPSFCVDHMRMTPPSMNLATLVKHVKSRCGDIEVKKVFINEIERTELTAEEICDPMTIEIE
jgi:hypothetical protein